MASPKPPFRVSYLSDCFDPLAGAVAFAARSSLSELLENAINMIELILAQTPRTWGDPQRNYPGMKATQYVRHMVSDGIRVIYLVHNSEPVVIVRSISPIRGGPFRPDPT
jgi:hypothetical protein